MTEPGNSHGRRPTVSATDPGVGLQQLLTYALDTGLISPDDLNWGLNRLLEVLQLDDPGSYLPPQVPADVDPGEPNNSVGRNVGGADAAVKPLLELAVSNGLIEDTPGRRDLLDAALFGALLGRPTEVIARFWDRYRLSPRSATDDFYAMSVAANYIHADRSARNPKWTHPSRYGDIDMTINRAKPEKDPRDIIAASTSRVVEYPKCLLCPQNEGYRGRSDHPARQNLRLIPLRLGGTSWALQYSPYLYYPEHCIVLSTVHEPMRLTADTFERLLEFVQVFPEYFLGSNADLPIVGGSILSHDHFQGGRYEFPIERAVVLETMVGPGDLHAEILDWPLTTVRLAHADPQVLVSAGASLLQAWREHDEPETDVVAYTGTTSHNTVTPIARRSGDSYQLDIVLRNNRTSEQYPDGIFHPHQEIHPVKKENIGLIEVMGLAVLPGRLADDVPRLAQAISTGEIPEDLRMHAPMLAGIDASLGSAEDLVRAAIGDYFVRGLEHCGVFGDARESLRRWQRLLGPLGYT